MISYIEASGFPYLILYKMVSLNKIPFYGIIEIYFLNESKLSYFISWPSINILPSVGSYSLYNRESKVVFPNPLYPTIALVDPGSIFKLKFLKRIFS